LFPFHCCSPGYLDNPNPALRVGVAQNGKIEDLRGYWDRLALLRQLGLVPSGPETPAA